MILFPSAEFESIAAKLREAVPEPIQADFEPVASLTAKCLSKSKRRLRAKIA
jgi:hypothetical protein